MHFSRFFRVKYIVRRVVEVQKSGTPCFLCQSLLLSTTVLNDKQMLVPGLKCLRKY